MPIDRARIQSLTSLGMQAFDVKAPGVPMAGTKGSTKDRQKFLRDLGLMLADSGVVHPEAKEEKDNVSELLTSMSPALWTEVVIKIKKNISRPYKDIPELLINLAKFISQNLATETNPAKIEKFLDIRDKLLEIELPPPEEGKPFITDEEFKKHLAPTTYPALKRELQKIIAIARSGFSLPGSTKQRQDVVRRLNRMIDTNNAESLALFVKVLNESTPPFPWDSFFTHISPKIGAPKTIRGGVIGGLVVPSGMASGDDKVYADAGLRTLLIKLATVAEHGQGIKGESKDSTPPVLLMRAAFEKILPNIKDQELQEKILEPRISDAYKRNVVAKAQRLEMELKGMPVNDPKSLQLMKKKADELDKLIRSERISIWNPSLARELAETQRKSLDLIYIAFVVGSTQVNKATFNLERGKWEDLGYTEDIDDLRNIMKRKNNPLQDPAVNNPGKSELLEGVQELLEETFKVLIGPDLASAARTLSESRATTPSPSPEDDLNDTASMEAGPRLFELKKMLNSSEVKAHTETPVVQEAKKEVIASAYHFAATGEDLIKLLEESTDEVRADYETKLNADPVRIRKILAVSPDHYGVHTQDFLSPRITDLKWQDELKLSDSEIAHLFAVDERRAVDLIKERKSYEDQARARMPQLQRIMDAMAEKVRVNLGQAVEYAQSIKEALEKFREFPDQRAALLAGADPILRVFLEHFPVAAHLEVQKIFIENVGHGLGGLIRNFSKRAEAKEENLIPAKVEPVAIPLNFLYMALTGRASAPFMRLGRDDDLASLGIAERARSHGWLHAVLNEPNGFVDNMSAVAALVDNADELIDAANQLYQRTPSKVAWAKLIALADAIPPEKLEDFINSPKLDRDCRSYLLSQYVKGNIGKELQQKAEAKSPAEMLIVEEISAAALKELAAEFKALSRSNELKIETPPPFYLISVFEEEGRLVQHMKHARDNAGLTPFIEALKEVDVSRFTSGTAGHKPKAMPTESAWYNALLSEDKDKPSAGSAYYYTLMLFRIITSPELVPHFVSQDDWEVLNDQFTDLNKKFHMFRDVSRPQHATIDEVKEQAHFNLVEMAALTGFQNILNIDPSSQDRITQEQNLLKKIMSEAHSQDKPYLTLLNDKKMGPQLASMLLNTRANADVNLKDVQDTLGFLPENYKQVIIKQIARSALLNETQRNNLVAAFSTDVLCGLIKNYKSCAEEFADSDAEKSRQYIISSARLLSAMLSDNFHAQKLTDGDNKKLQETISAWSTDDFIAALNIADMPSKNQNLIRLAMLSNPRHVADLQRTPNLLYHVGQLDISGLERRVIIQLIKKCEQTEAGAVLFKRLFDADQFVKFSRDEFKKISPSIRVSIANLEDAQRIVPLLSKLNDEQLAGLTEGFTQEQWRNFLKTLADPSVEVPENVYRFILNKNNEVGVEALKTLNDEDISLLLNVDVLSLLEPKDIVQIHPDLKVKLLQDSEFMAEAQPRQEGLPKLSLAQLRAVAIGIPPDKCDELLKEWNPEHRKADSKSIPLSQFSLPLRHQLGMRLLFGAYPRRVMENLQVGQNSIAKKEMMFVLFNDLGASNGLWYPEKDRVSDNFRRANSPELQDYMFDLAMRLPGGGVDLKAFHRVNNNEIYVEQISRSWDKILESTDIKTFNVIFNNYQLLSKLSEDQIVKAIDRAAAIGYPPSDYHEAFIALQTAGKNARPRSSRVSDLFVSKAASYVAQLKLEETAFDQMQQDALRKLIAIHVSTKNVSSRCKELLTQFAQFNDAKSAPVPNAVNMSFPHLKAKGVADVVFSDSNILAELVRAQEEIDDRVAGKNIASLAKNKLGRIGESELQQHLYGADQRDENAQYKLALFVKKNQPANKFDALLNPIIKKHDWKAKAWGFGLIAAFGAWWNQRRINKLVLAAQTVQAAMPATTKTVALAQGPILPSSTARTNGQLQSKTPSLVERLLPKAAAKEALATRKAAKLPKKKLEQHRKEQEDRAKQQAKKRALEDERRNRRKIRPRGEFKDNPAQLENNKPIIAKAGRVLMPVLGNFLKVIQCKQALLAEGQEIADQKESKASAARAAEGKEVGLLQLLGLDEATRASRKRQKLFHEQMTVLIDIGVSVESLEMSMRKITNLVAESKDGNLEQVCAKISDFFVGANFETLLAAKPDEMITGIIKLQNALNKGCKEYKELFGEDKAVNSDPFYKQLLQQQAAVDDAVKELSTIPQYKIAIELTRYTIALQEEIAGNKKMRAEYREEKAPADVITGTTAQSILADRKNERGVGVVAEADAAREKRNEEKREGWKEVLAPVVVAVMDRSINPAEEMIAELTYEKAKALRASDTQIHGFADAARNRYPKIRDKLVLPVREEKRLLERKRLSP